MRSSSVGCTAITSDASKDRPVALPGWSTNADATRVVSLSLPIDAPAPDGAAEHYQRGLLPEDPVALRDMMRASGATSTDTFELLRQVGG